MTKTLINLLGRQGARKLDKTRWICEMRILRSIHHRHPHWYNRLFSRDLFTWLSIRKKPWYFDSTTQTIVYKPLSNPLFHTNLCHRSKSLCQAMCYWNMRV